MAEDSRTLVQKSGLWLALGALLIIVLLPQPEGLPVAGQRMLGLLVFSVILWMTEAVSYPVSAAVILSAMTLLLGFSPSVADPNVPYGMNAALVTGLKGLSNGAWAMVAAALFLAVGMQTTGFDRRLALKIMSLVGTKSSRLLLGVIGVGFTLSFFVPSTTARVACIVPIVGGIIASLGINRQGKLAGLLMIACAQVDSIWNVGIKTAAAQNMIAVNFIRQTLGVEISWLDWLAAAAPFAILMSVILYFVLLKLMPPEIDQIPGGDAIIKKELEELGPMKGAEFKLMIISICLLLFWVLEGKTWGMFGIGGAMGAQKIHPFSTAVSTILAVTIMLIPSVGIMNWKDAQKRINWGTIILFGIGISLGSAIISTKAGVWLAKYIVSVFGLAASTPFTILAILALFLIVIHMGFASATALASAMIPIIISVLTEVSKVKGGGVNILGMTMILQYVVSFGFILPVNAPQNMIAYGTETFTVRDFVRTGIPLTIIAYAGILLMAATYWKWLGYV
ncbi:SLC13 family permease [Desulfovibrio legallii]|jgi:anion transporter|uniref:Anion transporter n=1 Tax=Desulfovibrio legallii TaxID=571438 RepID=A0A1G7L643_9BACT|nr:DASS family sodium-coupled anion symporter [Desulfovibrio legallii]SDF44540.1 anion transporter [Desulfovibrio legallii]